MNIALIGYGKMGQAIETIALQKGHNISHKINRSNQNDIYNISPENTDVAIEFTNPESAFENISILLNNNVKTISGSTGWIEKLQDIHTVAHDKKVSFLWASNFSLGVNLFFEINSRLAKMMSKYNDYQASIKEIHHTHKKDAPSGTAITLAQQIMEHNKQYNNWHLAEETFTAQAHSLPITAERIDPAPGTHTITYHSSIDDIEITHTAHSREGFALGAVVAAEYLATKNSGIYTMKDVLDLP